jgi:tetratricopeptide (TPR) repeat protein
MSGLISGYNYDIFISYRQKDNKRDGWVTEFVDNLKGELESTFKEEISVYFDINPHDGLLETHDVDASLKDKLKCLVFIPIISRTYCDPNAFAWEHEFKTFVELASQDQFGLKVRLPNGNVANRVLPIRIYDLDNADIKLCETVLRGVLRGVEFIYAEPGVNRPLKSDDNEKINLNKTKYRNQINKVGNAIQEIISGLLAEPIELVKEKPLHRESLEEVKKEERKEVQEKPTKTSKRKLLSGVAILAILIIAAILTYPKIFKRNTLEKLRSSGERISVAVFPFQNMTNDTSKNFWQVMVQDNLINSLSNSEEIKVRQTESIINLLENNNITNFASITPSIARKVSQKLDAHVFVHGSINQIGTIIRLNAKLVDSKTDEIIKSFQKDGTSENILPIIDILSAMVRNFLLISKLGKENIEFQDLPSTNSPEAYKYFILGKNAFYKGEYSMAINWLNQALAIDSNLTWAMWFLSASNQNLGLYEEGKKWSLKYYLKRETLPLKEKLWAGYQYEEFLNPKESIKYLLQLQEIDDQAPNVYFCLGWIYARLQQYDNAIPEFEKALEIYNKWGSKPSWSPNYWWLGHCYHKTGQYKKEKKLYKKAEQVFPNDLDINFLHAALALSEGDKKEASEYIDRCTSYLKERSRSEATIANTMGGIYYNADILDKAEEYYRQALSLEPENHGIRNNLAYFLINKESNINEGLDLVERALKSQPDNYSFLHTKGLGLFKQGKYQEALETLQKSWNIRRERAIYNHEAFLHLEAAKKAVASQKNN